LFTSVTYDKRETGIQKAFSNPSSKSLLLDSGFQEKAMVAPWWAINIKKGDNYLSNTSYLPVKHLIKILNMQIG
jgi:hypothetical protein